MHEPSFFPFVSWNYNPASLLINPAFTRNLSRRRNLRCKNISLIKVSFWVSKAFRMPFNELMKYSCFEIAETNGGRKNSNGSWKKVRESFSRHEKQTKMSRDFPAEVFEHHFPFSNLFNSKSLFVVPIDNFRKKSSEFELRKNTFHSDELQIDWLEEHSSAHANENNSQAWHTSSEWFLFFVLKTKSVTWISSFHFLRFLHRLCFSSTRRFSTSFRCCWVLPVYFWLSETSWRFSAQLHNEANFRKCNLHLWTQLEKINPISCTALKHNLSQWNLVSDYVFQDSVMINKTTDNHIKW